MPILKTLVNAADKLSNLYEAMINAIPIPTTRTHGAFYHVVTALSRTALKNYALLREALDTDDQEHLAWACRNLLELDVFMKNVLISKERMKEFGEYRWADAIQIVERLVQLETKYAMLNPQGTTKTTPTALEERRDKLKQQMASEGVLVKGHLLTRLWAAEVGMGEDFDIMNKVCSKFVHPTVWSVLTEDIGSARFPDVYELFYFYGARYLSEMYADLRDHINKYGFIHKR